MGGGDSVSPAESPMVVEANNDGENPTQSIPAQAALDRGQRAWPTVVLSPAAARRFVEAYAQLGAADALSHGDDLYLACACATGDASALRAFDRAFGDVIARQARSIDPNPAFGADVRQRVMDRLFVAAGNNPPKIATFSGRGPMRAWLTLVARRVALDARPSQTQEDPLGDLCERLLESSPPVERELFRRRYQPLFARAMRQAFAELDARSRALLRLAAMEGLSHARIAELFEVAQPTVSRWLAQTRDTVAARTRVLLAEEIKIVAPVAANMNASEATSVIEALISHLDLSLSSVLAR